MKIFSNFIKSNRFETGLAKLNHVDFSLFYDYRPNAAELALSAINILIVSEPNEYFKNHDWAIENFQLFDVILTWSDKILNKCDNSLFQVYGESWLDDTHLFMPGTKSPKIRSKEFKISFLRGSKLQSYGHMLRHELFDRQAEIKNPIEFWKNLGNLNDFESMKDTKELSFSNYEFSICVENNSHEGYFTEKITDCILCKTIPIYWGCSNIENFYDKDGIIQFQNVDDAIKKINKLDKNYYRDRLEVVKENYNKAFEYRNYIHNIEKTLINIFCINNIT